VQAEKYNIYPLLGDTTPRLQALLTKGPFDTQQQSVLYPGVTQLPARAAPSLFQHSFSISAEVEIKDNSTEGILLAAGGRFTGFSFYVQGNKLKIAHNNNGKLVYLEAAQPLKPGKAVLKYTLQYTPAKKLADPAGTEALYVNDVKAAERKITKADATIMPYDEGVDVGLDNGSAVAPQYKAPFAFTGVLHKIIVDHQKP